jgi:adenine deaminase
VQISKFIQCLPKAELHLHIEGSFEPELMFSIAQRNNIELPFEKVEDIRAAYNFSNLQDFLNIYYQGMNVLQEKQDFYDLTLAYLQRAKLQNVRHVEIFFDPQGHTERGIEFYTVISGIYAALEFAQENYDMSFRLIMCFLRHLSEEAAFVTLQQAEPFRNKLFAVGLDSSECGHPPSKFQRVFSAARNQGYRCVAHAGEEGPPSYIREAVELLKVDRIDHGNRVLEDEQLTRELAQAKIGFTVCPMSNYRLQVVRDYKKHPLKRMLDSGLVVTVNSDDPAFFGGYINENFEVMQNSLHLENAVVADLARASFTAAFMENGRRVQLLKELDTYLDQQSNNQ